MSMMRFGLFFRELAERETRTLIVREPRVEQGRVVLPADEYGFDEWYCVEPGCDCRRVMLNVLARRARMHVATISHAFDPPTHAYDPPQQTFLDPLNPQSRWAATLLEIFVCVVLADEAYRQRLVRHYRLIKDAVGDPTHPCQSVLGASLLSREARQQTQRPRQRRGEHRRHKRR